MNSADFITVLIIFLIFLGGLADYCLLENGGCDQLCFNKCDKKTSCGCLPGYLLAYDKRTCLGMLYIDRMKTLYANVSFPWPYPGR